MSMRELVRFVSSKTLVAAARPDPLIQGFLREQEAACLYGVPNGGKSFLSLDWALCVATGKPWLDTYEVKQGPVIYMAGEGEASLQVRVQAWMKYHQISEVPGAWFQTRPLPLRDDEIIDAIQEEIAEFAIEERGVDDSELQPRLAVVDTLSQFMMGGDENGPDMALFVANIRRLSHDNNMSIVVVHHTDKGGIDARGHSALRGNLDVMFRCNPVYQDTALVGIDLSNDKQRDAKRAGTLNLKTRLIDLGVDPQGEKLDSLVIVPTMEPPSKLPKVRKTLLGVLEAMLQVEDLKSERCVNKDIAAYLGDEDYTRRGSLSRWLDELHAKKLVHHGVGKSYLTTLGRAVLDKEGITREQEDE